MAVLRNDPRVREAPFSLDEELTFQQEQFVGARLPDSLIRYAAASRDERLRELKWARWPSLMDPAYACGFVSVDAGEAMGDGGKTPVSENTKALKRLPAGLEQLTLRRLRRIVHCIMRSEWCGNAGYDTGGGAVWDMITSRLGDALARRLGA